MFGLLKQTEEVTIWICESAQPSISEDNRTMVRDTLRLATARARIIAVTAPLTILLGTAAVLAPTGFAIRAPGPTEDTLGTQIVNTAPIQLVEITGASTYPTTGRLLLTTVSVSGGPIGPVMPMDVLFSWAVAPRTAIPQEVVFPAGITRAQQQEQSQAQMLTSQQTATLAALGQLGIEVPATMSITGFSDASPAADVLKPGDVIVAFNGEEPRTHAMLLEMLSLVEPGSNIELTVKRDGTEVIETFPSTSAVNADGTTRAALGVFVASDFHFPVDVAIQIDAIGGPSAGMMFALAIIDRLTPHDELQGTSIAGTGTISSNGAVGAIGGIRQKMFAAQRDGANWFLAPLSNCNEVTDNIPRGLNVVAVSTLSEALDAVTAIGSGQIDNLPSCLAAG
jgi:PDZ domain-containing protein